MESYKKKSQGITGGDMANDNLSGEKEAREGNATGVAQGVVKMITGIMEGPRR